MSRRSKKTLRVAPFPRKRFLAFCKKLKIQSRDFGLTPFELVGSQKYILDEICRGTEEGITTFLILKARQLGSSTFFLAIDLFWAFEYSGLSGAFATHTEQSRDSFRQTIEVFLAHLPRTHKIKAPKHNRSMVIFKNGSQLTYLVAGTKDKKSSGLGRSGAYNFAHCTEVAFWGSEDDLKAFRAAQSSIYPHRLQIYETTANGFNFFNEMYEEGKNSRTQRCIFVGWWRDERNQHPADHPFFDLFMPQGAETRLTALERRRVQAVKQLYGVDVTANQISWYRWKLEDEFSGDQLKMDEEFPWTEEDAFVATGSKFFTGESLTAAMRFARVQQLMPYAYSLGRTWQETGVHQAPLKRCQLKIWEEPIPGAQYAIGCDPAYGSSDSADRTVIQVFRCYADRCVQAAEFVSPVVSTYQCAWVLAHLAGYYGDVMVNLEITGPGQAVFQELNALRQFAANAPKDAGKQLGIRDCLGAMRHFLYRRVDTLRGDLAYQWRTTHETKVAALNGFKDSFELERCVVKSMYLLDEMKSMVHDEGSIEAEGRAKDDRVMAAALAHEAWKRWLQPRLQAMGWTWAKAEALRLDPSKRTDPLQIRVLNYIRSLDKAEAPSARNPILERTIARR